MTKNDGKQPQGGTVASNNSSGDRTAEIDLYKKGDITVMMAAAGSGRLQPMRGFDEDYTDIVDYIVRCTHKIWEEGAMGLLYTHYSPTAWCTPPTGSPTAARRCSPTPSMLCRPSPTGGPSRTR
jgi:hypothetical protein